jgi:hypothetical protein
MGENSLKGDCDLKHREEEFCRLVAVLGDPAAAARMAGYRDPQDRWPSLIAREDIAREIRRASRTVRGVYEDAARCSLYRVMFSDNTDALRLLYRETIPDEELAGLNLSGVAEIKRTKDKSVEIKFFDRLKALDKLSDADGEPGSTAGGLLEAMRLSARAILASRDEDDTDGV